MKDAINTYFWGGHNTDTFWVPRHTTPHQKVQQLQDYNPHNINSLH